MPSTLVSVVVLCSVLAGTVVVGSVATASTAGATTPTSNWMQVSPATSPVARYQGSMTYDAATGTVILFGGYSSTGSYLGDTWSWNGTTWTQLSPATSPPARGWGR